VQLSPRCCFNPHCFVAVQGVCRTISLADIVCKPKNRRNKFSSFFTRPSPFFLAFLTLPWQIFQEIFCCRTWAWAFKRSFDELNLMYGFWIASHFVPNEHQPFSWLWRGRCIVRVRGNPFGQPIRNRLGIGLLVVYWELASLPFLPFS